MSDTPTERSNTLLWTTTFCTIICCFPWYSYIGLAVLSKETERVILYVLTAVISLAHIHYGTGIVSFSK